MRAMPASVDAWPATDLAGTAGKLIWIIRAFGRRVYTPAVPLQAPVAAFLAVRATRRQSRVWIRMDLADEPRASRRPPGPTPTSVDFEFVLVAAKPAVFLAIGIGKRIVAPLADDRRAVVSDCCIGAISKTIRRNR